MIVRLSRERTINFVAKYSIYVITLLFMIVCAFLNHNFLTGNNLINILRQVTVYAMIGFAQSILIISGNLDLCAGSTCCFAGLIGLFAYQATGESLLVGCLAAMASGVVINAFSGSVVAFFNLPPFVATLGMQMAIRGLYYIVTGGAMISQTGENFRYLGQGFIFDVVPVSIVVMLVFAVLLWVILDRTVLGRNFYAVGGNREAARACGINLKKYTIYAFLLSGVFVGMSGMLYASRVNAGMPSGAQGYEGQGIAATVIGGIGFAGGTGSAWGAIVGAIVLGIITNILNLLGVDSYVQQIVNGLVIVFAVGLDTFTRGLRTSQ